MKDKTAIKIFLLYSVAIAMVLCVSTIGHSNRHFVSPQVVPVTGHVEAYRVLEEYRLKGRFLLLFERHANFQGFFENEELSEQYFLVPALKANFFRTILHIIPDGAWGEVSSVLGSDSNFIQRNNTYYSVVYDVPLTVSTLNRFQGVDEKAVVLVDGSEWTPTELNKIISLFATKKVVADLVVIKNTSPSNVERFRAATR